MLTRLSTALDRAALTITGWVSSPWCAVGFTVLALVSLPGAVASHSLVILVAWIAQTFLQLVLLSILAVQQRLEGARVESRDQETHDAVLAEHGETRLLVADVHALLLDVHALLTAEHVTPPEEGQS